MYKIFIAPLIDSFISYLIEEPIQYYFYINYFKNLSFCSASILITFLSIVINIIIFIISYFLIFNISLTDKRYILHAFIIFITILFTGPLYFYYSLSIFSNYLPEQIIFYSITIYYILSYFGKLFFTYYIWENNSIKLQ